jgi:hypothetical protein
VACWDSACWRWAISAGGWRKFHSASDRPDAKGLSDQPFRFCAFINAAGHRGDDERCPSPDRSMESRGSHDLRQPAGA